MAKYYTLFLSIITTYEWFFARSAHFCALRSTFIDVMLENILSIYSFLSFFFEFTIQLAGVWDVGRVCLCHFFFYSLSDFQANVYTLHFMESKTGFVSFLVSSERNSYVFEHISFISSQQQQQHIIENYLFYIFAKRKSWWKWQNNGKILGIDDNLVCWIS